MTQQQWSYSYLIAGVSVFVPPLLVCEQGVRLQPGCDVRVHREAVLGTGSLKLSDLGENLKLLENRRRTEHEIKVERVGSHSYKTPPGGDTYSSAFLKVDESTLWEGKNNQFNMASSVIKDQMQTTAWSVMCSHLHCVSQCCVQHGQDGQICAQVRHNSTAQVLGTIIKPWVYNWKIIE